MLNLPAVKEMRTVSRAIVTFELPEMFRAAWWAMKEKAQTGYWNVKIGRPRKPRTTGDESQNHAINGFCQQIAVATGNSFSVVKDRMKELAIGRGYPFETLPDGAIKPKSEADIDTIEAGALIDAIKQFAAEYDIRLIEGDEDE